VDTDHRRAPPSSELLDVVAIGSSLVDVLSRVDDEALDRLGLVKGSMALVDGATSESIYDAMGPGLESSGGSAANTAAGVAALGGTAGFIGKVADDPLGRVFTHDIRACGVDFEPSVDHGAGSGRDSGGGRGSRSGDGGADGRSGGDAARQSQNRENTGTGRCLVLVTGDAERTMATHLGVATSLGPEDVPEELIARSQVLYLEGYLWDLAPAKEAMRQAITVAHTHDAAVALSMSDPLCVERHRREFLDLLVGQVDVVFANEEEIVRLFKADDFDHALAAAEETGLLMALTRGPAGSVVITPTGPVPVPAHPVRSVVDTTGAGDLYAAGFLYGLARGWGPGSCAELGGRCAAEIISHLGARPQADLRVLAAEVAERR
jgi:sugar/nucleoside kinase (ribokinase family)